MKTKNILLMMVLVGFFSTACVLNEKDDNNDDVILAFLLLNSGAIGGDAGNCFLTGGGNSLRFQSIVIADAVQNLKVTNLGNNALYGGVIAPSLEQGKTVIFEGVKDGVTLNAYKGTRCDFTDSTPSATNGGGLVQVTLGEGRSFSVSDSGDYFFVASTVGSPDTLKITGITVRK